MTVNTTYWNIKLLLNIIISNEIDEKVPQFQNFTLHQANYMRTTSRDRSYHLYIGYSWFSLIETKN